MLLRPFTLLVFHLALSLGVWAGDAAVSTGTDNWGMTVFVSQNPRECAPFEVYYDISHDGDPPGAVVLPDAAAVSFLTPDSSAAEWMVLQPPMGTGMLSWTCALPAGTQFVILNRNGFKQMFTVGPSESASGGACWGNASDSVTTSSKYGSLDAFVYRLLLTDSYTPITIPEHFNPVEMPSTVGLDVVHVSLGAPGRDSHQKPSSSSERIVVKPTTKTEIAPLATRLPQGPTPTTAPTERASPIPSPSHTQSKVSGASPSPQPSAPGQTPSQSPAAKGEPAKRGFVIGAVVAALALGALLGACVVTVLRRRKRKLKSHVLAFSNTGVPPAPEERRQAKRAAPPEIRTGANDRHGRSSDPRRSLLHGPRTARSEDLPSYRSSVEL